MQGKRKRKSVESFQASTATPAKKKRLSISDGHGRRLGDLNLDFGNRQSDELRPLYRLLFNTPGQVWVGVGVSVWVWVWVGVGGYVQTQGPSPLQSTG